MLFPPQLARDERVELLRGSEPSADLAKVFHFDGRLVRSVEVHHLDGALQEPGACDAQLLSRQPSEPRLLRALGRRAAAGAPLIGVRLQPLERPREAEFGRRQEQPAALE